MCCIVILILSLRENEAIMLKVSIFNVMLSIDIDICVICMTLKV